ncbi:MAG: hypothetical protein QGH45_16690 [Myxococcota bacterium]|nr:hypothetical protein [Myxococcota bacterium]
MLLPLSAWAWLLVGLAALNLGVHGLNAALLVRAQLRRHRPLLRLAHALKEGDLGKASFQLDAIPDAPGEVLRAYCGRTVDSGPLSVARDRFLRGLLVAYPSPPLLISLLTGAMGSTAALLPLLVGIAVHADAAAAAADLGTSVSITAGQLAVLGAAEAGAGALVAIALAAVARRMDPGAPGVRRRLVRVLGGVR